MTKQMQICQLAQPDVNDFLKAPEIGDQAYFHYTTEIIYSEYFHEGYSIYLRSYKTFFLLSKQKLTVDYRGILSL